MSVVTVLCAWLALSLLTGLLWTGAVLWLNRGERQLAEGARTAAPPSSAFPAK